MKQIYSTILFIAAMCFAYGQFHPSYDPNWEVVFEDHFNTFNGLRWWKEDSAVRNSGTWEEDPGYYLSKNAYISNGELVLRVTRDTIPHNTTCYYHNMQPGDHYYSSASVVSCNKYQYGYFEIRAQVPISDGKYNLIKYNSP